MSSMGIIIIGRNEGERLLRCFGSLPGRGEVVVYVDSGSTDGSVAAATEFGAHVVALDMAIPFNAGRARREGVDRLLEIAPETELIQFIDGDCELEPGWLDAATAFLRAQNRAGVVCGRRRERFPEASIYNRLCDLEWNTPVGEADACGGDSLMRVAAYHAAGGFSTAMVAGEEPELCGRIRKAGWSVWRIDAPMTLHDAAMHRFGQWWMRGVRGGFGYAQVLQSSQASGQPLYAQEVRRAKLWAGALPLVALLLAIVTPFALLAVPMIYAAQIARIALRQGGASALSWQSAFFTMIAKFPELQGILRYYRRAWQGKPGQAILYK